MTSLTSKLSTQGPAATVRLAWRKFVYRKVTMRRVGAVAASHVAPQPPTSFRMEILGRTEYRSVLGTSPHLSDEDLDDFDRQTSSCIVAFDGDRLAASTWMTSGQVHVHELHRWIEVPAGQHFSTRTFVDPDYRGNALMSHMIYHYSQSVSPADEIWGLVYDRNIASLKALQTVGWQWTGNMWTTFRAGRKVAGANSLPPLPAAAPSEQRRTTK